MSFDKTSPRDHAAAPAAAMPAVVGKRAATASLSAPDRAPAGTTTSAPSTLHGTGWLAGVLGFVDGPPEREAGVGPAIGVPPPVSAKAKLTITTRTAKPAPDGSGTARTVVGVGEVVHFTGSKAGQWSASSGDGTTTGKTYRWEGMEHPGEATITLRSGNASVSQLIQVIAPTTLQMVKYAEDTFPKGTQGVGMRTHMTIGPTSVCFGNVGLLEVGEGPSNITGYFTEHGHAPPTHKPNKTWVGFDDHNGDVRDHAWLSERPKPWSPGGFQWVIPNKYRVNRKGEGTVFITTHQVFHITDHKGTTTITKGGATATRTP